MNQIHDAFLIFTTETRLLMRLLYRLTQTCFFNCLEHWAKLQNNKCDNKISQVFFIFNKRELFGELEKPTKENLEVVYLTP